ncbi:zinc finger MYM-type protein 3-like [Macrosteles quadrilineatus]|uniref:zinc finger MYM-type protein 3-like n=1 Tax=Macrosteles quadrilineatus TaxID=74068 RepID=UPI0023E2DFBC|nr:zinc finger MYM-type protein 3-like [Macrosteles quadrilineatus]
MDSAVVEDKSPKVDKSETENNSNNEAVASSNENSASVEDEAVVNEKSPIVDKPEIENNSNEEAVASSNENSASVEDEAVVNEKSPIVDKPEIENNSNEEAVASSNENSASVEDEAVVEEKSPKVDKPQTENNSNDEVVASSNDNLTSVEDVELNEAESNKNFEGDVDEDELLKDTEENESSSTVTDASKPVNPTCNVDSTDDNYKKATEQENLSNTESSNVTTDQVPDSSNENLGNAEIQDAVSCDEKERNEANGCTSKNEEKTVDPIELTDSNFKEGETSEADTDVTSSNIEEVEKEKNVKAKENSISTSDEIENLTMDAESKEATNTCHISDSVNKNDSLDGTKFLHVEQENSRPEDSFEEPAGEDPFAQTSDVAMDTSETNEKEDKSEKSDAPADANEADVKETQPEVTMELSESVENKEENGQSKPVDEPMDVDEIILDSEGKNETASGKTTDDAENKTAVSETGLSVQNTANDKGLKTTPPTEPESGNQNDKSESGGNGNTEEDVVMIEDDRDITELRDVTKVAETTTNDVMNKVHPHPTKAAKPSGSRHRKKSSSDSDSDIDFQELKSKEKAVKRTPKRNAAKIAESQIKVLSQLDKETNEESGISVVNFNKSDRPSSASQSTEGTPNDGPKSCFTCKKVVENPVGIPSFGDKKKYFCDNNCVVTFRDGPSKTADCGEIMPVSTVMSQLKSADIQPMDRTGFVRKCAKCTNVVNGDDERTLSWETMDFCSEECLGKYQTELGSHCANCKGNVQQSSLGKYCVRFGYEVKQFCCSTCLEEFKKGLKVCSFCQKDISSGAEGFLAPVGDKGTFKDFCTPACMEKYEQMSSNQNPPPQMCPCAVCNVEKLVEIEVCYDNKVNKLCSDICFTAYKFANQLSVDRCDMCKKYFDKEAVGEKFNIFYEGVAHNFCCKTCMNVYILAKRKIVPCNWCKVKKYNFDMIKRVQSNGQVLMMCSLNCLTLYQVSINAVSSKRIKCDMCNSVAQAQYHLTMSDATIRNFCTYPCVMNFQQQYSKTPITLQGNEGAPIPTGAPKRVIPKSDSGVTSPVISSVTSLANGQPISASSSAKASGKLNLVARLCEPPTVRNKFTQTQPVVCTKSVSCRPHANSVHVQTDDYIGKAVIPIPVPIFIPCPMAMYSMPFPVPTPFPIPIPVPVFLPTTRNSIKGIMKELKRIQEKVPDDPFEAELLMMAEMVAEDKSQKASSDSEPEADNDADNDAPPSPSHSDADGGAEAEVDEESTGNTGVAEVEEKVFTPEPEPVENSNAFGEDIVQLALKMATELTTPASGEDLETQLPSSNIQQESEGNSSDTPKRETRSRKRAAPATRSKRNDSSEPKRKKSQHNSETSSQPSPTVGETKPDVNMKLKYTFGVNAWKTWVTQKNAEIERLNETASKKLKPFKTDMLQLTLDELNFTLCLFVKEVKKPNGTSYAPDTIYYLCLGIQQFLFESGRIDNIFTDPYFETFTDALDEVAKKFSELFSDHHYIVTRVEEEHLWESKQLGAHSPHVLLSTLMFFNTKHFNLTSVDEHLLLSFSHIMKHWKRNQNQSGAPGGRPPGSRNVLLRFYPPQALIDDPKLRKKKVYEQQEDEENPLRCPVKLYEFYLSKCPESVKNRNDVFYLQPERSCVPDSPVWYSTMALQREPLEKMLNRVKMVKEINIALLVP